MEATACGNVLIQALALGHLDSLAELRKVVRDSFPIVEFHAEHSAEWSDAFERFQSLTLSV